MKIRSKLDIRTLDTATHAILMLYPFYKNSSAELRDSLRRDAKILRCRAGQILYGHKGPCDKVLLIGSGSIRVYVAGESGREFTLYHVAAGEICPVNIQSACDNAGVVAYAEAQETLEAVVIPAERFRLWLQAVPGARHYLFDSTFERFVTLISRVRAITTRKINHRLIEFLLREFGKSEQRRPAILKTHEDIAVELGTAREVVSRRLQKLENAGAIELLRGRIVLLDKSLLRQTLEPGNAT
jgi:CRP/FNR family transcriptional regulator